MTFNTARTILAIKFYGTEEGKEINRILNQVDENPWQTGTPTEEGLYWVFVPQGKRKYTSDCFDGNSFVENGDIVVAWIPITPFEASKENA